MPRGKLIGVDAKRGRLKARFVWGFGAEEMNGRSLGILCVWTIV